MLSSGFFVGMSFLTVSFNFGIGQFVVFFPFHITQSAPSFSNEFAQFFKRYTSRFGGRIDTDPFVLKKQIVRREGTFR